MPWIRRKNYSVIKVMLFKSAPCIHTQWQEKWLQTSGKKIQRLDITMQSTQHPEALKPQKDHKKPIRKRRHTDLNNMYQGLMTATAQSIVQHKGPRLLLLTQVIKMMYRHMLFQPAPSPPSPPPPPPPPLRVKTTFLHTEF